MQTSLHRQDGSFVDLDLILGRTAGLNGVFAHACVQLKQNLQNRYVGAYSFRGAQLDKRCNAVACLHTPVFS